MSGDLVMNGSEIITNHISCNDDTDILMAQTHENANGSYIWLTGYNYDSPSYENSGKVVITTKNFHNDDFSHLALFPNGNIKWNHKEVERIFSSGSNYIRYESGLQICWGHIDDAVTGWNIVNFPLAFLGSSSITLSFAPSGYSGCFAPVYKDCSSTSFYIRNFKVPSGEETESDGTRWCAIGWWK